MNVHGEPPTTHEMDEFCKRLNEITATGGIISLVQIYTVARQPAESFVASLSNEQVDAMARELQVKPEDVREMESRLAGGDVVLDPMSTDDGEEAYAPIAYLTDTANEPGVVLEARRREALSTSGIRQALDGLDSRSRHIVEERWLKVNDDNSGGMTLHELADVHGVSAERIRQIEVAAMKKMKLSLEAFA